LYGEERFSREGRGDGRSLKETVTHRDYECVRGKPPGEDSQKDEPDRSVGFKAIQKRGAVDGSPSSLGCFSEGGEKELMERGSKNWENDQV